MFSSTHELGFQPRRKGTPAEDYRQKSLAHFNDRVASSPAINTLGSARSERESKLPRIKQLKRNKSAIRDL